MEGTGRLPRLSGLREKGMGHMRNALIIVVLAAGLLGAAWWFASVQTSVARQDPAPQLESVQRKARDIERVQDEAVRKVEMQMDGLDGR